MEKLFAGDGEVKVGSDVMDLETRLSVIRALIPLGLEAVADVLQQEVEHVAGVRYARKGSEQSHRRWGSQKGSVYLMDQKLPVAVPRVRDVESDTEVSLAAYRGMQRPRAMDEKLLLRVLKGISCRNYRACAESVPEAFGISASSVSRRFIKATAKKLKQFQERPLDDYDLVALFIDGKSFADEEIVIAPGVTTDGQKIPLGFVESATENERICRQLIQDLIRRGLCYDQGLLVVLDGSKGLRSAVTKALKGDVCVHRCQWHKRENVVSYLPEAERPRVRRKLQKGDYIQSSKPSRSFWARLERFSGLEQRLRHRLWCCSLQDFSPVLVRTDGGRLIGLFRRHVVSLQFPNFLNQAILCRLVCGAMPALPRRAVLQPPSVSLFGGL